MERAIRHELSQQELIFNDRVDVFPAHCLERVYAREMYKKRRVGEFQARNQEQLEETP